MDVQNILVNTRQALINVIKEFSKNSFNYFYEEDIRSHLYSELKKLIPAQGHYNINKQFSGLRDFVGDKITTDLIKAEYPYSNGTKKRFDISILKKDDSSDFYNVPSSIGFEIKLGSRETKVDNVSGFYENILSLRDYQQSLPEFHGLALYFYQTQLQDVNSYFKDLNIVPIEIDKLNIDKYGVYALIICGDGKHFKVTSYDVKAILN